MLYPVYAHGKVQTRVVIVQQKVIAVQVLHVDLYQVHGPQDLRPLREPAEQQLQVEGISLSLDDRRSHIPVSLLVGPSPGEVRRIAPTRHIFEAERPVLIAFQQGYGLSIEQHGCIVAGLRIGPYLQKNRLRQHRLRAGRQSRRQGHGRIPLFRAAVQVEEIQEISQRDQMILHLFQRLSVVRLSRQDVLDLIAKIRIPEIRSLLLGRHLVPKVCEQIPVRQGIRQEASHPLPALDGLGQRTDEALAPVTGRRQAAENPRAGDGAHAERGPARRGAVPKRVRTIVKQHRLRHLLLQNIGVRQPPVVEMADGTAVVYVALPVERVARVIVQLLDRHPVTRVKGIQPVA